MSADPSRALQDRLTSPPQTLRLAERDGILEVTLERGKVNALDLELLTDLEAVFGALAGMEAAAAPRAVVLTGAGRAFSAGVDLFRVVNEGRPYLERFLPAIGRGLTALFTAPVPVVAAVGGHAIAGGAVLMAAADRRLGLAGSKARLGVPELLVGVPFPTAALEILRFTVSPRHLQRLIYGGATLPVDGAMEVGLLDELVEGTGEESSGPDLLDAAFACADQLARIPPATYRLTKNQLRRDTLDRIERREPLWEPEILEIWSAPETLETIRRYLEATVGKGKG